MIDAMEVNAKHSERLKALQAKLDKTDAQMGEMFGVSERAYVSWKYRERNPSKSALVLLDQFAKRHRLD